MDASREPLSVASAARPAGFDVLRGVGAILVVLFHFTTHYESLYTPDAPSMVRVPGRLGVPLFFILSGYGAAALGARGTAWPRFVFTRAARLWPAYAAACGLTLSVVGVFGLPGREVPPRDAWLNLTTLHSPWRAMPINGAYWSLEVEMAFYALVAICLALGLWRWRTLVLAVLVGLYLAQADRVEWMPSLEWSAFFLLGSLTYDTRAGWRAHHLAAGAWAVAGLVVMHLREPLSGATPGVQRMPVLVTAAIWCPLVWYAARGGLAWACLRPLGWLGGVSYTLYLVHQNIGYVVLREAAVRGWGRFAAILAACGVALALAVVLAVAVERPAYRVLRGVWERRAAR